MKKNLFYRCLFGAPTGLAISYAITIIISLFIGDGRFHAVVPELTAFAVRKLMPSCFSQYAHLSMAPYGQAPPWFGKKKTGVCCVRQ